MQKVLFGLCVVLNLSPVHSFPNRPVPHTIVIPDQLIGSSSQSNAELNRNGTVCGPCDLDQCPPALGCRAGSVLDSCGCCEECANLEGQACDLGDKNVFHGLCGTGLVCRTERGQQEEEEEEEEEAQCVCEQQEALCGSDGRTYMNICQYREASFSNPHLRTKGKGPCKTVPIIKVPPVSQVNGTGSSLVLLCEVFAFPMALVEWRKEGWDVVLPGDDPHISVQSRGGPLKYELSSWLQIEEAEPEYSGTYRCVARNNLGSVSASAVLGVLRPEEMSAYLSASVAEMKEMMDYSHPREYEQDYY
ncbi:kazal-type serine peptidase inhibitor domain 3 [Lampris incognitus]|uniref:kazal-type serine peptidase inhibitor domain 3 n=1 Tax=Lampris incognitus TaxID=2546036 RepID=UPI0024B4C745|nr:kazal-type serine peptidase inhibitor domain 3 [Lampris incognitus]